MMDKKKEAIVVHEAKDILKYIGNEDGEGGVNLKKKYKHLKTIFIDEGQFFEDDLAMVVQYIDDVLGIDVKVAGLDMDFKGEPFGQMPRVMAVADRVIKHNAVCKKGSRDEGGRVKLASRTQRIIDGKPANYDDPVVVVGAKETYKARSKKYHVVPGKPKPLEKKRD